MEKKICCPKVKGSPKKFSHLSPTHANFSVSCDHDLILISVHSDDYKAANELKYLKTSAHILSLSLILLPLSTTKTPHSSK